jgi:hypothetical protein
MKPDLALGPRWRTLAAGFRAAARWRGPDAGGVALGTWLALAAVLAVLAWLFAPVEPVLQLAPPFLAAGALWPAWRSASADGRVRRWSVRLEWPVLILLLLWLAHHIFEPTLLKADKPIDSADHQMLLFRVQLIADALAHGRWDRWTHLLQGGEAVTDLYPFLFDLLVALVHRALPFALKDTYTGIVVVLLVARALAVYALCRRFGGPLLAAAFAIGALADSGVDIWDGGTHGVVFWGLMHSQLSLTLALIAMRLSCDLLDGISGPRLVACTLLTALTALAHPIGVFIMAVWLVSLALAAAFRATEARPVLWTAAALALGLALPAYLVLPAVRALGQHGFSAAFAGYDYRAAGATLVRGLQPSSSFGFAIGVGLIAVGAAAASSQVVLAAAAIASLLLFAYMLTPLAVQTRLLDFLPSLVEGQPRRNAALLKLTALPAMTWLLAHAFAHLDRVGSMRPRVVLGRAVLIALLLLGPGRALVVGVDEQAHAIDRAFDRPPEAVFGTRIAADEVAVFDWLAARRKQDPSPTLWRVAVSWPRRWRHTLWGTGLRTGVPVVDFGWVSGNFLAYRPRELTIPGLRDWSVRYLLTEDARPPLRGATQVFQSGDIWVWEIPGHDGLSVIAPPGVQIHGLRYEPDGVRFTVTGAPPAGAIVHIRTAWFPAWRARQNGAQIPLWGELPRPDARPRQEQLTVKAGNGEVLLTCDGLMPGSGLAALISLAALAALVLASTERGRARGEAALRAALARLRAAVQAARGRVLSLPHRRRRLLWLLPVLLLAGAGAVVRLGGFTRLRPAPWELSGLSATARLGLVTEPCRPSYWLGRARCGDLAELDLFLGEDPRRDDTAENVALFPALRFICHEPAVQITASWRNIRLAGRTLEVRYQTADGFYGSISADGTVLFEGSWNGSGTQRLVLPASAPRTGTVVFRVRGGSGGALAVDARTVPVGPPVPEDRR